MVPCRRPPTNINRDQYEPIGNNKSTISRRCVGLAFLVFLLLLTVGYYCFLDVSPEFAKQRLPQAPYHQALLDLNHSITGSVVFRNLDRNRLENVSRVWVRNVGLPYALVLVATEADVEESIRTFREHDIPFRIRSGGHHKLGYSTLAHGVVLDMQKLNQIQWKTNDTLQLGPATTVQELYDFMRPFNVSTVMGFCGSVGEAGFVLGGGWGIMSRSYGLGIDNALDFRIVLANASAVAPDDELDWALRGAGGGSFGVVTSMSYRVHPISQVLQLMIVHIPSTVERADFLHYIGALDPPGNMVMLHDEIATVNLLWWGESDEIAHRGEEYFTFLLDGAGALSNVTYEISSVSWDDVYRIPANASDWGSSVYAAACWTGFLMPENNTKFVWREIMGLFDQYVDEYLLPDIELWGGAISDRSSNATAFPYRGAVYNVGVLLIIQEEEDRDLFEKKASAVDQWWPHVAKYLQGTYVNYPMRYASPGLMWGEHLPRLKETKKRYDPGNMFHQSLGVPL